MIWGKCEVIRGHWPKWPHGTEWQCGNSTLAIRVVLDSFFRADSTLTQMTIQVTQLWLNSNTKFANMTQLRLNSKPNFTNLTQLWLNSFESELSQIWLTTHHILPNLRKSWWPGGGGVRSNVAVGWFFLCKVIDNCKIFTFSLRKISDSTLTQAVSSWLNSDSNDDQRDSTLTRLISLIFTADSNHGRRVLNAVLVLTRRRVFAICEKPQGVGGGGEGVCTNPPPVRARVKSRSFEILLDQSSKYEKSEKPTHRSWLLSDFKCFSYAVS